MKSSQSKIARILLPHRMSENTGGGAHSSLMTNVMRLTRCCCIVFPVCSSRQTLVCPAPHPCTFTRHETTWESRFNEKYLIVNNVGAWNNTYIQRSHVHSGMVREITHRHSQRRWSRGDLIATGVLKLVLKQYTRLELNKRNIGVQIDTCYVPNKTVHIANELYRRECLHW